MSRWGRWGLPLLFFITCAGWAITSPVGSSPDDDYHLTSIWCAGGERDAVCQSDPADSGARLVPANVVHAADCYRFDSEVGARCTQASRSDSTLVSTTRVNAELRQYPGGFYQVHHLLIGPDVDRSVLAMRLLNCALAALVIAAVLWLAPAGIAAAFAIAVTASFIPLGLFVTASTNPSGWASIGVVGTWALAASLLRLPTARNRAGVLLASTTTASALLAISARADACTYLVLALVLAAIVGARRPVRSQWPRLTLLGALALIAFITYLSTTSAALVDPSGSGPAIGTTHAGVGLLMTNLVYLPVLFQGIVGGWNLGWNDTLMPPFVPVVGTLVVGGLLWWGLQQAGRRAAWAAGVTAAALIGVPIVFLQVQQLGVGEVVQPRYLLPLLPLLLATAAVGKDPQMPLPMARLPRIAAVALLSASGIVAFWANAHRYLVGSAAPLFDRDLAPTWQPLIDAPVLAISLVTAAATITTLTTAFSVCPQLRDK